MIVLNNGLWLVIDLKENIFTKVIYMESILLNGISGSKTYLKILCEFINVSKGAKAEKDS